MKLIILLLSLSFSVFGEVHSTRPMIFLTTFSYQVQVRVNNYSNDDYTCSGQVYMNLTDGSMVSRYYFARVYANSSDWKVIYPPATAEKITYARHSIFCY